MRPGVIVDVRRDLAVEVLGNALPDVGLDQTLEPVGGNGAFVEGVEGRHERRHRHLRRHAQSREPLREQREVLQLLGREHGERRLVPQVWGQVGVFRELGEGAQLAVGQHAEQVRDRREVAGIGGRGELDGVGCGRFGELAHAGQSSDLSRSAGACR